MNKQEWAKLTNWNPDGEQAESEWETIHTVYQWHPAIPDQGGKAVLAGLFKVGGLGLLRDMEAGARAVWDTVDGPETHLSVSTGPVCGGEGRTTEDRDFVSCKACLNHSDE